MTASIATTAGVQPRQPIIEGAQSLSDSEVLNEIAKGGRLVVYTYAISLLIVTFRRPSQIRLVRAGQSRALAGWPYLLITILFGWWGVPWGPIYSIQALWRNLRGGADSTSLCLVEVNGRIELVPYSVG